MARSTEPLSIWPALPYEDWRDTCATLHLWLQIVGKIRVAQCPWVNHSWHVALRVTASGLTSGLIPSEAGSLQIDFDFIDHRLLIRLCEAEADVRSIPLEPQTTAAFYRKVMDTLESLGVRVSIHTTPNELPDPVIPLDKDEVHSAYDAEYANRYWRVLVQAQRVLEDFRARFIGKCSPVHFFWGSADLAVTRFSGRTAPEHPGGVPHLPDWVAREAYSHEVSSAGFWAGGPQFPHAIFYSYAYPEPSGFATAEVRPEAAHYSAELREFVLPYEDVRRSASPDEALLEFLQSTYEAAAALGHWDRGALERSVQHRAQSR
jgi:Family of unknown function (DUF5996)